MPENILNTDSRAPHTHNNHHHSHDNTNNSQQRRLTSPDCSVLQDDAVVDEADVLGGGGGAGPLSAQQVENLGGQDSVLAVLDELTQVSQAWGTVNTESRLVFTRTLCSYYNTESGMFSRT